MKLVICSYHSKDFEKNDVLVDISKVTEIKSFVIVSCRKCNEYLDNKE
jgi:hypothetical protein